MKDIKSGRYEIVGIKLPSDYEGNITTSRSKSSLTHKRLWSEFNKGYEDKPYNYLPRGRVAIYKGTAYIHINSLFNQPDLIDKIVDEYHLKRLSIEVEMNDTYQGSHYDFMLT